ncbi:hypothetical protein L195_g006329 [Trifolium pratense]|uniref:Uncharacterized protein n=1 Tax=Trifolium pratense TaxID=57577 RepID=A0A2K3P3A0_TRIPR|nr:hypothetical protein L195_g006329 [Trifolium pratense]
MRVVFERRFNDKGLQPRLWRSNSIELKMLNQQMKMQGPGCDKRRLEVSPSQVKESAEGTGKIRHTLCKGVKRQIHVCEAKSLEPQPSPEIALLQQQENNSEGDIGGVQRRPNFLILTVALCLDGSLDPNNLKVHQITPSEELQEGPGYRDGIRARPNGRELDLRMRLR